MPFPQRGCSFRCWCQASRRRESAGAGCGRLCASSLRCTRVLPYPARLLAMFFVARALQPERCVAGLLFRGVFLTTEDTEVTEEETAGRG